MLDHHIGFLLENLDNPLSEEDLKKLVYIRALGLSTKKFYSGIQFLELYSCDPKNLV